MKYSTVLFIPLLMSMTFWSCGNKIKTSTVTGYVFNAKTGQPLGNISVVLVGYDGYYTDSSIRKPIDESYCRTSPEGYYSVTVEGSSLGLELSPGYCSEFFDVSKVGEAELGKSSEVNMYVDWIDGKMGIILKNTSGANEVKFDVSANCKRNGEGAACCSKNIATTSFPGKTDTLSVPVSAGRDITLRYTNKITQIAATSTIFCPENGAAYVLVEY